MESPFPNSSEQIVASSLLLLSLSSSSSPSSEEITSNYEADRSESLSLSKSFSKSSASSTVSSGDVSSDEVYGRGIRMVANAIYRSERELKLKVVRKSRSRTLWISDCPKMAKTVVRSGGSSSEITEGSSTVTGGSSSMISTSTSEVSCKPRIMNRRKNALVRDVKMKKKMKSYLELNPRHLLHRSEAILNVLARSGFASEVRIREMLGDSPDTSKALRILLKKNEVRRSGAGGRTDPFIYQIAAK
uniref:probable GPI-anchored adhesin-like protein PGA55 n=1 Tax=Erigeron canadensis TaxID=72917 RepID=UPI001CB989F7|nr:probable GPI-anchored adhesin-like protein PGA55 [Erigeron canadensis]